MLSRTANSLYWIARYMERAENMARILSVGDRMSRMQLADGNGSNEWESALIVAGAKTGFEEKYGEVTPGRVIHYIALDRDNPSSIASCIETARANARSIRIALTKEMWESLNSTWLDMPAFGPSELEGAALYRFLDWVKERSLLYLGAMDATMLRDDGFCFAKLGEYIERSDNTARILDVKYHVLLPDYAEVGGGLDYYQWASILRAVSAHRSYRFVFKDAYKPWLIADFLILRTQMPRSLISCVSRVSGELDTLRDWYGEPKECNRLAGKMYSELRYLRIEDIFQKGLHEFLGEFTRQNNQLGTEIETTYLM